MISGDHFSSDVLEFLVLVEKFKVRYMIIGGEAVIYYGFPRLTGDMGIFYDSNAENIDHLYEALLEFWQGDIPGLTNKNELGDSDAVFQFGVPPNRIDLLSDISAVDFNDAWMKKRIENIKIHDKLIKIFFIGLDELIENKKHVARPKDQEDLKYLVVRKKKVQ